MQNAMTNVITKCYNKMLHEYVMIIVGYIHCHTSIPRMSDTCKTINLPMCFIHLKPIQSRQ